ncbi:MAG: ABC transporter permease [Phycisphaerae bacterium]
MSLRWTYLWRNLTRNRVRTMLTCAAVGLPMVIYVLSWAVVDGVEEFLENSARQLRLAVANKASIIVPLPEGHRQKIEALARERQRAVTVCSMKWIGGTVDGKQQPLSTLGVDADTFIAAFPEFELTPQEQEAWVRDKQAIIVGNQTAAQFGWSVGQRITIRSSIPPYAHIEFHVVSTAPRAKDKISNWFHRSFYEDRVQEMSFEDPLGKGRVSFFFVKCASKEDLDLFRNAIDQTFAHSLDETKTQDEKAFMNEFITQQFNLPRNLTILCLVTVFVAVMAATNTMSMNFRDRLNEYATLKSLGFRGRMIFGLVQIESLAVCALGGGLGALTPYVAFTFTPLRKLSVPVIQTILIRPAVCGQALVISVLIGLIAAAWPSWLAVRMHVVAALRNLE